MTCYPEEITASIRHAADLIRKSHNAVILTGAGISTPSGIPDFRSPGMGLWTHDLPMEVASLSAFRHDPEHFYMWLHPLAIRMFAAQPNPAHQAIAQLQLRGYIHSIITQNIDGLLSRAGARDVIEVHGSLNTLTCTRCFKQVASEGIIQNYVENKTLPCCPSCGGILKPDVILYEEQLPIKTWNNAEKASRNCDLMIVAGTSLEVMPAAKLPVIALDNGASLIVINNADTYIDVRASVIIKANVADIFPQLLNEVLNG